MGLLSQPPHCQISVPPSEIGLLKVTMDDIRAVPLSLDPQVTFPAWNQTAIECGHEVMLCAVSLPTRVICSDVSNVVIPGRAQSCCPAALQRCSRQVLRQGGGQLPTGTLQLPRPARLTQARCLLTVFLDSLCIGFRRLHLLSKVLAELNGYVPVRLPLACTQH